MDYETNPVLRFISNIREWGLEYTSRRFYGLYQGIVTSNADLRQQAKISVAVPVLGSGQATDAGVFTPDTLSTKAYPAAPYAGLDHGIYFPPENGDMVWVSFDHGDPTVPRYHGSWWNNADPAKSPVGSHLPAEFQSIDGIPSVRGIKTGRGHGLIFSDSALSPYVLLWSGKSTIPGQPADKFQRIILSDDPSGEGIAAYSHYGHAVELNDTKKTITIRGRADDPSGTLVNSIVIDDFLNKVTIKTKTQEIIELNGTTKQVNVTAPGAVNVNAVGAVTLFALGGIAQGSGAAPPAPPAPGTAVETGAGNKIVNFLGAWTETIGGAFTQTVAGALTQNVVGVLNMTAASMNLAAVLLTLTGNIVVSGTAAFGPAPQKKLINEDLILNWLATHTHPTAAPGPPSPPVQVPILKDPLDATKPNPIWITQSLTAS